LNGTWFKINTAVSVQAQKEERKGNGERVYESVYVLRFMVVTFPTFHAERSPLKAPAKENTAPQQQTKVQ